MPVRAQIAHGPTFTRVFARRLLHAFGLITVMEHRHLREPHYYIPYVGVAPAAQGQGLGTALMRPTLERCDHERLPAYLEATSKRNATLYERLGFEHLGAVHVGSAARRYGRCDGRRAHRQSERHRAQRGASSAPAPDTSPPAPDQPE